MHHVAAVLALVVFLPSPWAIAAPGGGDAAQQTQLDGLRLLGSSQDRRLTAMGVNVGYVEKETRPGEGMYVCGALDRNEALSGAGTVSEALGYFSDSAVAKLGLRYVV